MQNSTRFVYETRPRAMEGNTVCGAKYRFTVLTASLIRMEYNDAGIFEDRASQTVFFRDFNQNKFSVEIKGGLLCIETENLFVKYEENKTFSSNTLVIKLKNEPASSWHYGEDFEELGGTTKTLDASNGSVPLEKGLCSRNGFSVLDDSKTLLLNEKGWVEPRNPNTIDSYFFGYGFKYLDAVKDYYRLTGIPPLLPAYALGNWWSRYHKYTQTEYQQLIERFEKENIPFSVSVVDMDWHITELPEDMKIERPANSTGWIHSGWTGYTWNKELFPDYCGFLKFLREHHLKTALNLHPAQGIRCHEEQYVEMAEACGVNPEHKKTIPLDILSPEFMEHYFDILHHPYEEAGVDFWWMDWQQGTSYWWIHEANRDGKLQDEREIVDPLWMLNHLHIADIQRTGKRPMFFSRYSGPGSHRYPIGFSGDTIVTWESLDFQPYFTATASNIGYSWWSHDIGGHTNGYRDDELTVRWIQLGVFSPINRLHSTDTEFIRKEPWCFDETHERIITEWLRLRHRLFPYIYTMNYRNHYELEPLVQPMYYAYPKCNMAYEVKNQYFFGSELMVAPITQPSNKITQRGCVDVWFPKGDWFDFFTGMHYASERGRKLAVHRKLHQYPVFAKAGAIVPMQIAYDLKEGNDIQLFIFPGADNKFVLYEDAGEGQEYKEGQYVKTSIEQKWSESPMLRIASAEGDVSLLPETRTWHLVLRGYHRDVSIKVYIDNQEASVQQEYDNFTNSHIFTITANRESEIKLLMEGQCLIHNEDDALLRCTDLLQKAQCGVDIKNKAYDIVADGNRSLDNKLVELSVHCACGPKYAGLISALKEQLIHSRG